MASSLRPYCGPFKTLRELLQEQQEPFLLQVYLSDNGYLENHGCNCWPENSDSSKISTRFTKKTGSKNREVFPASWCRLLKSVLRTISIKGCKETWSSNGVGTSGNGKVGHSRYSDMEGGRVLDHLGRRESVSNSFLGNSVMEGSFLGFLHCNVSSIDGESGAAMQYNLIHAQKPINTKVKQKRSMEEWKQLSPVSVLEVASEDGSPIQKHDFSRGRTFQVASQTKHSHWRFVLLSVKEKMGLEDQDLQELDWVDSSSHTANARRLLRQSEELLLDCVMEAAHNLQMDGTTNHTAKRWCSSQPHYMETKAICDEIYAWAAQEGDVANITQLLQRDLASISWGHSHTEPHKREEIAGEIADAIFESICQGLISDMSQDQLAHVDFLSGQRDRRSESFPLHHALSCKS